MGSEEMANRSTNSLYGCDFATSRTALMTRLYMEDIGHCPLLLEEKGRSEVANDREIF